MTALTASHRQKVIERLRARPKLAAAYMQAAIEADCEQVDIDGW